MTEHRVTYSDMQSGKTAIISQYAQDAIKQGYAVFIFVQNRLSDLEQLRNRLKVVKSLPITVDYKCTKLSVFLCLYNVKVLKKVNRYRARKYVIILDEADFLDSGSDTAAIEIFEEFCQRSVYIHNITATPLTTLAHRTCLKKNFRIVKPPVNYKGLNHVEWKKLAQKATPANNIDSDPFVSDPNLTLFLEYFHTLPKPKKQPRYTLIRLGRTIEPQLIAARYTGEHYPNSIVITWNGSNQGTTMRGELLSGSILDSEPDEGVYHYRSIHIGRLISWLSESNLPITHIIVYAGVMADRGITFGADNYLSRKQNNKQWWHLTDLYYITNKDRSIQNLSTLLQTCGRICGVYDDDSKLTVYTNWVKGIRYAYELEQRLIKQIARLSEGDDIVIRIKQTIIEEMREIGKLRLTNQHVEQFVEKEERVKEKVIIDENNDYIRRAYLNKYSYIHRIIKAIGKGSLTKEELEKRVGVALNMSNYDRWDKKHNKYCLLERVGKKKWKVIEGLWKVIG